MKYTQFVRFVAELYGSGATSLFLQGTTFQVKARGDFWCVRTNIVVADRSECEKLLDSVPLVEKLRLERARTSLQYEDGALVLVAEIPKTSRFLAARSAFDHLELLTRFWKESLSSLTLLVR